MWKKFPLIQINNKHLKTIVLDQLILKMTQWKIAAFQSLSHVQLFATPWTAAHQASLSFIISQSLPKVMSIESVMPSNHLIFCCPLLFLPSIFPSIRIFTNESAFHIRWPKCWASTSASVLPMNIQDRFPLLVWLPCWSRDSQESSPTPQFKSINSLILIFLNSFLWASLVGQMVKNLPAVHETRVWSLGQEDPL